MENDSRERGLDGLYVEKAAADGSCAQGGFREYAEATGGGGCRGRLEDNIAPRASALSGRQNSRLKLSTCR